MKPPLYTRDDWGADLREFEPARKPAHNVVVHHTATRGELGATILYEARQVRAIEDHHVDVNGWRGIGYNFVVTLNGRIFVGRGWGRVGAHTAGRNSTSVGIALLMHSGRQDVTPAALEAARWLIEEGVRQTWIAAMPRVTGHRDWAETECPGDRLYVVLDQLRGVR